MYAVHAAARVAKHSSPVTAALQPAHVHANAIQRQADATACVDFAVSATVNKARKHQLYATAMHASTQCQCNASALRVQTQVQHQRKHNAC